MKKIIRIVSFGVLMGVYGCTDLNVEPKSNVTANLVFNDPESYTLFLAKLYAGLAITGQIGPTGNSDIKDIDEGASAYLRQYWKAQELTTDEAVIGWGDDGLADYHDHDWVSNNQFVTAMYNRIFFQVSLCNEFLRETTEAKLNSRSTSEALRKDIRQFRAEARFLRAFSYWHGIDMFGSIPLVTEETEISTGTILPVQSSRQELFTFVESELKAIESELAQPKKGEYGRADQAAAWTLLAKLYLNASIYTGQNRYTEAVTYCKKVIDANAYSLTPMYQNLFLADNNTSGEIIFSVNFDSKTRTWGGMTFLTHAAVGGSMDAAKYGLDGGWWGTRTTSALVDLFPDASGTQDKRAIFYTNGQTKDIGSIGDFTNGYAVPKFKNITSTGTPGANTTFPDTDFPVFRLADVYLMYAEAVLRGGAGGSIPTAVGYINKIRERAYQNTTGNIQAADLNLAFILNERARELYWEGHRRTDLIRFGQFSDKGIWPWKGGVKAGKTTDKFRDLFPIPASERTANPQLKQNTGY